MSSRQNCNGPKNFGSAANNNKGKQQPNKPKPPPGFTYVKTEVLVPVAQTKNKPKVIKQTIVTNNFYQGDQTTSQGIPSVAPSKPCQPRPPPPVLRPTHQTFAKPATIIKPTVPPQNRGNVGGISWELVTPASAGHLSGRCVVGGHEGWDGSPLWVIRARQGAELIPGKFAAKHGTAYVPFGGNEVSVQNIEVLCMPSGQSQWVSSSNGGVPPKAIIGGNTATGEPLYIGRAKQGKSLTPGKVHCSHGCCYISFGGKEIAVKSYEVLCKV